MIAAASPSLQRQKRRPPVERTTFQSELRQFQAGLRGQAQRHRALLEIVHAVNATLEPAKIAELIVSQASRWVPTPSWVVVSSDLAGQLAILAERGLTSEMGPAIFSIAKWVLRHNAMFSSADLRRDGRVTDPSFGSVLAVALLSRGRPIGVLIGIQRLASSHAPRLTPSVARTLSTLLEPAATALDHALLLKRAEALSVTDDLTQLYNSRFLRLALRRETKRASRNGHPLSLLFLDLDGFKGVNDTHGHLFGSRTLAEVAVLLRACARETDFVARFGGDEFAIVLPETGSDGALAVAARVRSRIEAQTFLESEGLAVRLTVSVGIATLPVSAASAEELMHAADLAMYAIKESGKNGVRVAPASTDT